MAWVLCRRPLRRLRVCGWSALSQNLGEELGAAAVEFHVAEFVDDEQVDTPVPGDRARYLLLVSGFDEFVHQSGRARVFDLVALLRCRSADLSDGHSQREVARVRETAAAATSARSRSRASP